MVTLKNKNGISVAASQSRYIENNIMLLSCETRSALLELAEMWQGNAKQLYAELRGVVYNGSD
jgi:hypothetical protein